MNECNFTGRICDDLELKKTQNGVSVLSFTLAVKRRRVKDVTDFIPCVVWRQSAEYLSMYARKGDMIEVTGSLESRKWEDRDGNKRTAWEIQCEKVGFLASKGAKQEAQDTAPSYSNAGAPGCFEDLGYDDELPFN
ncbi:MAG: single-stranded DNA-binding protein [Clostridia bacterium]|nr:single-stranded DNA-binding protein [Clostridia bacterium]